MTWSPSTPAGESPREGRTSQAPTSWAPEELALDTSGLHERFLLPVGAARREAAPSDPQANAHAQEQAEVRAREDAYSHGFEAGRQAGAHAEATRLREAMASVNEALEALHIDSDKWVGNAEEHICALAVAIARHVIGKEIAGDRSSLTDVVRQALAEFPLDHALTLRVNPSDLEAINAAFHSLGDASPLHSRTEIRWMGDARIAPGGCLIEGRDRIVDGRVDTALERVYRRLTYTGA
ncbi:MAG: FliH/SctL family protein [Gemmatimonadaceae bacterium]|nr:FliH/SctL family protein [Gemmatimonadaceae bacterium]